MDLAAWTPRALSVLRIMTGLLFLEHGTGKLLGFPPSDHAAPTLFSLIGVQGVLELVGGFLNSHWAFHATSRIYPRW
jgi:putative oxidoreductase